MDQSGSTTPPIESATNHSPQANETDPLELDSEKAFGSISFGLGCSIVVINIVSLAFLIRHRGRVSGNGFWQQLLFLCFTDILTGVGTSIFYLGSLLFSENSAMQYTVCVSGLFLFPISITLSFGNFLMISIHRHSTVKTLSQQVPSWNKRKSVEMIVANLSVTIITAAVSVLVLSLRYGFNPKTFCNMIDTTGNNDYKLTFLMGSLIIVVLSFVCTNIVTILSMKELRKVTDMQLNSGSVDAASPIAEANRYATQTFILIVVVLNLTTVPTVMFYIFQAVSEAEVSSAMAETFNRIMCINSLFNPFIYSLRMNDYRRAVWEDFKAVVARLKCTNTEANDD